MQQQITIPVNSRNKGFSWSDFFSFRKMITFHIMQIVYVIVAGLITIGGLITLFAGNNNPYGMMPGGVVTGLFIIIFGNILWRIWCELIIVFFRINNTLSNIDENTRKDV